MRLGGVLYAHLLYITNSYSISHRINLTEARMSEVISTETGLQHKQLFNISLMDSVRSVRPVISEIKFRVGFTNIAVSPFLQFSVSIKD
jgi:hypothetical protein